jgi:ubiquinone/menaquinone biosynthesis C-methylase UbiE
MLMRRRHNPRRIKLRLLPARLRLPLLRCARGELPANVALSHLFIAANSETEAERAIGKSLRLARQESGIAAARLRSALDLWRSTPGGFHAVKDAVQAVSHEPETESSEQAIAHWGSTFDCLARTQSAESIALYSLGSSSLLRQATDEIIGRIGAWNLLAADATALEIGCGNGRVMNRLARQVRLVAGVDISFGMLCAAREQCKGLSNTVFVQTSGSGLGVFASATFDLVYAVDSFPYIVQAGLADLHMREAARVLKPSGGLLILNYSYRGDLKADSIEVAQAALQYGLAVARNGTRDLKLWDGRTFLLQNIS